MSILSAQCIELRTTAVKLERMMRGEFDAIRLSSIPPILRDAADTIDGLRTRCQDVQRDYYNLRNAMWNRANARAIDLMTEDELRGLCTDLYDHVDELKALARDMHRCLGHHVTGTEARWDCTGCPLDGTEDCGFEQRMESLGVEVDG